MKSNMFVKLADIADNKNTFRIVEVKGVQYKKWDDIEKRMLTSPTPKEGFRKAYTCDIDTGHGIGGLDLSERQMADILELCFAGGMSNPVGVSLQVKKVVSGEGEYKRTSYYFNKAYNAPEESGSNATISQTGPRSGSGVGSNGYPEMPKEDEVNVDEIPF